MLYTLQLYHTEGKSYHKECKSLSQSTRINPITEAVNPITEAVNPMTWGVVNPITQYRYFNVQHLNWSDSAICRTVRCKIFYFCNQPECQTRSTQLPLWLSCLFFTSEGKAFSVCIESRHSWQISSSSFLLILSAAVPVISFVRGLSKSSALCSDCSQTLWVTVYSGAEKVINLTVNDIHRQPRQFHILYNVCELVYLRFFLSSFVKLLSILCRSYYINFCPLWFVWNLIGVLVM